MQTKAAFGMRFHEVSSFFLKTSPPNHGDGFHATIAVRSVTAWPHMERAKGCHLMLIEFMSNPSTPLKMVCIMLEVWKIMDSWNFSWVMGCRWTMLKIIQGVIAIYLMLSFVILTILCLSLGAASDRWPSLSQDWTTPLRNLKSPAFFVPKDGNLLGK